MVKMKNTNPKRITSVTRLVVAFALLCGFFLFLPVVLKGLKGLQSPVEGAQPEERCREAEVEKRPLMREISRKRKGGADGTGLGTSSRLVVLRYGGE